jgi:quercetin dioxygenase-like cupin family protein
VSSYSTINLRDVADSVGERVPGLQGRFARKHLDSRDLGVSLFTYAPSFRSPGGHRHREQEEAYVVVSGSGRIRLDDEVLDVRQWDVIRVAPETLRAFEAGPDGLEVIAVGGPKPEGGDGVPSTDPWPGEAPAG